jgi:hypothetical protein
VRTNGPVSTVYNVRVADYHTYFVGKEEWGFSVWAHNADYVIQPRPDGKIGIFYKDGNPVIDHGLGSQRAFSSQAAAQAWIDSGAVTQGQFFNPVNPVHLSDAHSINSISSRTRFGGGSRTAPKTIATGDVNLAADIAEINAGRAVRLPNGDITTSSGRVYGGHPGLDSVFPRSGSPSTVDLTQAEFSVLREMMDSGGLTGNARKMYDGMRAANNSGLSPASEQKLIDLYNSRRP